jgi:hypothetical protein
LHSPALAGKLHKVVRRAPAVVTSRLARFRSILLAGAGAAFGGPGVPAAFGQDQFVATWLWDVTTQNGDAIVEPGETATITLSIDFTPNVGEVGKSGHTINSLSSASFSVLGELGAEKGVILDWFIDPRLTFVLGDTTTTDGVSLFDSTLVNVAQFHIYDDPIVAIQFQWSPTTATAHMVEYASATKSVWLNEGWVPIEWEVREAVIRFHVIPAPGTAPILAIVPCLRLHRRRRSQQ